MQALSVCCPVGHNVVANLSALSWWIWSHKIATKEATFTRIAYDNEGHLGSLWVFLVRLIKTKAVSSIINVE